MKHWLRYTFSFRCFCFVGAAPLVSLGQLRQRSWHEKNIGNTQNSQLRQAELKTTLLSALKACSALRELEYGNRLHSAALEDVSLGKDLYVGTALVDMYSKCMSMSEAKHIFDTMPKHDIATWNALILGYTDNGQVEKALELFYGLNANACLANERTFVAAAKACTILSEGEAESFVHGIPVKLKSLEKGMAIHQEAREQCLDSNVFLGNALIRMYGRCGSLEDAHRVFDRMVFHDVVSWNSLILGYAENGENITALELFSRTEVADARTYVAALMACTGLAAREDVSVRLKSLEKGMEIHSEAVRDGYSSDIFLQNTLVDMYSKYGSIPDALRAFLAMSHHSVVSWNALLLGFVTNGEPETALELLPLVKHADARTWFTAVVACTELARKEEGTLPGDGRLVKAESLEIGLFVHGEITKLGLDSDTFIANGLMEMYVTCGCIQEASKVFESLKEPDVVSWTTVILGHGESGNGELALELFKRMERAAGGKCTPNSRAFVAALVACCDLASKEGVLKLKSLQTGMEVHSKAVKRGYHLDIFVANSLLSMYSRCGSLVDARTVFDRMERHDVVSWNCLIAGYVENGESDLALEVFGSIGCEPNTGTYISALLACERLAAGSNLNDKLKYVETVMKIHSQASSVNLFLTNSLIDFYGKCGSMLDARGVFDRAAHRNTVSWNSLLLGYAANGENELVLELISCMDVTPDTGTYVAALTACRNLVSVEGGRRVRGEIHRQGLEGQPLLTTCMVDFHAKCGDITSARHVFDSSSGRCTDSVLWNTLMCGYSRLGDTRSTFQAFRSMREEGVKADQVSYLCVLNACNHAGMVDEGKRVFEEMVKGVVSPRLREYTCMVDMLGRADEVESAVSVMEKMPWKADSVAWMSVLGACRMSENVVTGEKAFEEVRRLDTKDGAAYSLMTSLYYK